MASPLRLTRFSTSESRRSAPILSYFVFPRLRQGRRFSSGRPAGAAAAADAEGKSVPFLHGNFVSHEKKEAPRLGTPPSSDRVSLLMVLHWT